MAKKNKENNYFSSNIKRWDREDFLWQMRPEIIQRDAKNRIFREMVQGKIDYEKYGKYYLDPKFLENLIITASNELSNNSIVYIALENLDRSFPGNMEIVSNKTRYAGFVQIYSVLLNRLEAVKATGNIGYLVDIQYVLFDYKNIL